MGVGKVAVQGGNAGMGNWAELRFVAAIMYAKNLVCSEVANTKKCFE